MHRNSRLMSRSTRSIIRYSFDLTPGQNIFCYDFRNRKSLSRVAWHFFIDFLSCFVYSWADLIIAFEHCTNREISAVADKSTTIQWFSASARWNAISISDQRTVGASLLERSTRNIRWRTDTYLFTHSHAQVIPFIDSLKLERFNIMLLRHNRWFLLCVNWAHLLNPSFYENILLCINCYGYWYEFYIYPRHSKQKAMFAYDDINAGWKIDKFVCFRCFR